MSEQKPSGQRHRTRSWQLGEWPQICVLLLVILSLLVLSSSEKSKTKNTSVSAFLVKAPLPSRPSFGSSTPSSSRAALILSTQAVTEIRRLAISHTQLDGPLLDPQIDRRKSPALWRFLNYQETTSVGEKLLGYQRPHPEARAQRIKPEIMAPAGGWPQLHAAIANGADAVYIGLTAFSARARAANFDAETELPDAVRLCHQHQVKLYVALNTLIFDHEFDEVAQLVDHCQRAGVDALIVQDLGLCRFIQKAYPDLPIHSSTQQTVTSADGVDFCQEHHGAERVVLGRELSVAEMAMIAQQTKVELEAFVHGALCVSYSGQCFSSEAWGGRSANRGQCAQACRMPYGLVQNGRLRDFQDMKYLLSPQDLCGLDQVPALIEQANMACLKIEGRLKDATYVAATTRAYRQAVDQAWMNLQNGIDSSDQASASSWESRKLLSSQENVTREELRFLFSRGQDEKYNGLTPGFMDGTMHQLIVRGRSPRHRGLHVGRVTEGTSSTNGLVLQLDDEWLPGPNEILKPGDGIVVDRGLAQETELGGPIFSVRDLGRGRLLVVFGREVMKEWKKFDTARRQESSWAPLQAHVWKTQDSTIEKKFRRLSEAEGPRLLIRASLRGVVGSPLQLILSDGVSSVQVETDGSLHAAQNGPMDEGQLRKAIGNKPFNETWAIDKDIDFTELEKDAWCPLSWVKDARRRAVQEWEILHGQQDKNAKQRSGITIRPMNPHDVFKHSRESLAVGELTAERYSVLCRTYEQVNAICSLIDQHITPIDEVIVDFLEVDGMREAIQLIRATTTKVRAVVASPRIIKPAEGGIWKSLLSLDADALLVRSTGLMYRLGSLGGPGTMVDVGVDGEELCAAIPPLIGDFSLNVANALTATEMLSAGLERVTASYDLNANNIATMGASLGSLASRLEVVVHCKMPIFHTEHCVFARFLTKGNSYLDCGHACTRNTVHLRDERGHDNLVLADMGCRNTVFAAQAQSGMHSMKKWAAAGMRRFRIELVDENASDAVKVAQIYTSISKGSLKASEAWEQLREIGDSNGRAAGITLGSFNNNQERRAGELSPE